MADTKKSQEKTAKTEAKPKQSPKRLVKALEKLEDETVIRHSQAVADAKKMDEADAKKVVELANSCIENLHALQRRLAPHLPTKIVRIEEEGEEPMSSDDGSERMVSPFCGRGAIGSKS